MARRDGLEGCRRRVDARSSCTSREPVRRDSMARAQPRRTRSATACRPRCAHAPPRPLPLRPMSCSECARCSSSRQSAQLCSCRWATRETPNHLAPVSNHVRVRPEASEWQALRCGLRAARDAMGGLLSGPWRRPTRLLVGAQLVCALLWAAADDLGLCRHLLSELATRLSGLVVRRARGERCERCTRRVAVSFSSRTRCCGCWCASVSHECRRLCRGNLCIG